MLKESAGLNGREVNIARPQYHEGTVETGKIKNERRHENGIYIDE